MRTKTYLSPPNVTPSAYEIVHSVHEAYRGIPEKLSRITTKSADWHRSHGYQPRTENPMASGNESDAGKYVTMCRRYEAAERGAGRMLNNRIHAALDAEFAEQDLTVVSQADIQVKVIDESCDVQKWLARFDLDTASRLDLIEFQAECDENIDALLAAKARARAKQRLIESERARAASK